MTMEPLDTLESERVEAACPLCGEAARQVQPAVLTVSRWAFYVASLSGLLFAGAGGYLATQTLPRFAALHAEFQPPLRPETRWLLTNGWVQPIPGCLVTVFGLGGVLLPQRGVAMLAVVSVLMAAALGMLLFTWLGLLTPELTLI